MGDSQIILHNSTFYLLMTPWAVSIQLMWAPAAPKVTVGPHTHLCLCSASKLAEAFWRLLSFDSWMCPKVPCVNTLFPLGWPSLDVIEPAAHLGPQGGRGSCGDRRIRNSLTALEQASGQAGPHEILSQRCKQESGRTWWENRRELGVGPWWNCETPASFHWIFLGPETSSLVLPFAPTQCPNLPRASVER